MIDKIIEASLKNRILVLMAFLMIMIWGFNSINKTPIDAIPDIGEMQVIVYADWPGRSPQDIEDQIIYPLTTGLMGTPKVKVVRSMSAFGFGLVNMIFEEGTDFYWARTRVLERLDFAKRNLPKDIVVTLGPDATALGQIFWYTVEGKGRSPEELRSLQDWYVKYQLTAVPGVSEVASVGGHVRQYQIDIDPNKLFSYRVKLHQIIKAVEKSNIDIGAKAFEKGGKEFIVRGLGFIKNEKDIENIVVAEREGVPIYVKNLGSVTTGPDFRRGALDKKGKEAVGGVVLMRYGENPLTVIKNIKNKIKELTVGLPKGVKIVPFYDRTGLILRAIDTLKTTLTQEIIVTVLVVSFFLLHFWASMIVSLVLPIGILVAFILMGLFGVDANIMSLGGIAIAVGVMVDSGIILVENIYRNLVNRRKELGVETLSPSERLDTCIRGAQEVGKPILFSFLIIIIGFIPVFVLIGQAGKLFTPLAFTKTFVIAGAAIIALTLSPVLSYYFLKGKLKPAEDNNFVSFLNRIYKPIITWSLERAKIIIAISLIIVTLGIVSISVMKQEFMPPLNEGDLLFMPVLLPGASLTQVMDIMKKQDAIIEKLPEVEWAVGKLGRAETSTDPAPVGMIETIIHLKDKEHWRKGMTRAALIREIEEKTKMPGVSPIMTQPIRNRIDMLATGIQTPIGIKVFGSDLNKITDISAKIEKIVAKIEGAKSPYAERISSRPYFEIEIDREKAARYGINVADIQHIIMTAIGGMNITTTIEGRERYPIRIRYMRELRDNPEALKRILIPASGGRQIPLSQLASLKMTVGPAVINSENTLTYARIFINVDQDKIGLIDFVSKGKKAIAKNIEEGELKLPPGYFISWSGQFESEMESRKRLFPAVGISLFIIATLLYMAFKKFSILLIIFTAVPISLTGGVFLLYLLGFKLSTAVWVGMIALFGVATQDGVVFLDTLERMFKNKKFNSVKEIRMTVIEGGLLRLRPIIITTATTILALIPVMFSSGAGSEIIKPMAAPTIGGLITATLSNLILVPVLYSWIKERKFKHREGK
jgi:copper/silver efflux system protein